ncbi:MAG: hypothetical protein ABEH77_05910 [Halobacteriaceae archaeon]
MEFSGDELAGVVDLFGALTREELRRALAELAFRAGEEADPADFEAGVEAAVESFALVEHDGLLAAGPAAFPTLPAGAPDLPHMLDIEERSVDREALARTVEEQLAAAAEAAADAGDAERAAALREVTYDAEAWGPVGVEAVRETLSEDE